HAETEQEQLGEAGHGAAQRREAAPDRERTRDYRASAGAVGKVSERHAQDGIKQGESQAADRSKFSVAQMQVGFDRLGEDSQDLPVEEIEDIGEEQEREHDSAASRARIRRVQLNLPRSWARRSTSSSS